MDILPSRSSLDFNTMSTLYISTKIRKFNLLILMSTSAQYPAKSLDGETEP